MSVSNQLFIESRRTQIQKHASEPFLISYVRPMLDASFVLSGTEFKVYMYCLSLTPHARIGFSPREIRMATGISKTSVRAAIKRLEDLGYLKKINSNTYNFYEDVDISELKERMMKEIKDIDFGNMEWYKNEQ